LRFPASSLFIAVLFKKYKKNKGKLENFSRFSFDRAAYTSGYISEVFHRVLKACEKLSLPFS